MYGSCEADALIIDLPLASDFSMSGAPSTDVMKNSFRHLLCGELRTNARRVVDREDRVNLVEASQKALSMMMSTPAAMKLSICETCLLRS
ncbi:hypothetical protein EV561_12822 [Rhizobium sp. BK376]|nr:hypothetical protein EV561_12822 [Rhizobium sp. BK376]